MDDDDVETNPYLLTSMMIPYQALVNAKSKWGKECSSVAEHLEALLKMASVKQQLRSLETAHPELRESRDCLEDELKTLVAANPDLRSERHASDAFAPPKLPHPTQIPTCADAAPKLAIDHKHRN